MKKTYTGKISPLRLRELAALLQSGEEWRFYSWGEWRACRREVLRLDRYECQRCKAAGRYGRADIVHHIEPVSYTHLDVYKRQIRYDEALPEEVEHAYPDYSLYPRHTANTAYGYLTRGCPNSCPFCIVSKKEGCIARKVADLSEFWRGQKNIKLIDANLLACKGHGDLLSQLSDSGACVDFTQGLDCRRLTDANIAMLQNIQVKELHFAWDMQRHERAVLAGLRRCLLFTSRCV